MRFSQVGQKVCQNSKDMLMIDKVRRQLHPIVFLHYPAETLARQTAALPQGNTWTAEQREMRFVSFCFR